MKALCLILVIETTSGLTNSSLGVVIEIGYVTPRLSNKMSIHGGDEGDHMIWSSTFGKDEKEK
jgi:hypothetical protein